MTDCQWNKNHLHPVVALQFLSEHSDDFCSVDASGVIKGWSILFSSRQQNLDERALESKDIDLGCRDTESLKISPQFDFSIDDRLRSTHCLNSPECISVNPMDESILLFANKTSIYMLERMGSYVEIIKEYSLKYDVAGIRHSIDSVISVAFCPWIEDVFVAGYDNGMICLFNVAESNPTRRFYDIKHPQSVISVSWMKRANSAEIVICALFNDGIIRFLDYSNNQEIQSYVFERALLPDSKGKYLHQARCKCADSLIAVSNVMQKHSFSVQRVL